MSLLDTFTGGKSNEASDALKRAEAYYANIHSPTARELTLPELQQYVEAGIMTPAEAQSYLQKSNAYSDMNVDQTGTSAQIQALNQLSNVANAGAEGTPLQQAQMANSLQQVNTDIGGQRGAIEQSMAQRGVPQALISAALQNQTVGQDAQQAHLDAVNGQAAAYQEALNAMSQGGALGGQLQGQQNQQSNTVAGAQNAMQQFNAANQQQNSQFNAGNRQEANMSNAANKQQISNNNTGLANTRTQYNANLPQQVFNNEMAKAGGMSGAATNYGNLEQKQGQQNAGIFGGLINTATSFIPRTAGQGKEQNLPQNYADGGYVDSEGYHCMDDGGMVDGEANLPGDSLMNDTVKANLSPGEAVIPRTTVQDRPDDVASLLGDDQQTEVIDPQDVGLLLKALRAIRLGQI